MTFQTSGVAVRGFGLLPGRSIEPIADLRRRSRRGDDLVRARSHSDSAPLSASARGEFRATEVRHGAFE